MHRETIKFVTTNRAVPSTCNATLAMISQTQLCLLWELQVSVKSTPSSG